MEDTELKNGVIKAIGDFLTDDDWHYKYDETKNIFEMGLSISNKLKSIDYYIFVKNKGFLVISSIEVKADDGCKKDIAEFLIRANYGLNDGCFEMNYDNGTIDFRMYHDCTDGIPSTDTVKRAVYICAEMIERYGNGLLSVMFGMQTPKEAVDSSEKVQG